LLPVVGGRYVWWPGGIAVAMAACWMVVWLGLWRRCHRRHHVTIDDQAVTYKEGEGEALHATRLCGIVCMVEQ